MIPYQTAFSGTGKLLASANTYRAMGFSVIPCEINKRPAITSWKRYQTERAWHTHVRDWFTPKNEEIVRATGFIGKGQGHPSIGLLLGEISNNIVVIDLDGKPAMRTFYKAFPMLAKKTLTIMSGSHKGCHLYFRVAKMPKNINVRVDGIGGFEIRGNGQYVIAPPSPHPSGNKYYAVGLRPIVNIEHLDPVYEWMQSLRSDVDAQREIDMQKIAKPVQVKTVNWKQNYLSRVVRDEIARVASSTVGNRNDSLFKATMKLANYCAGGELDRIEIENKLLTVAQSVRMPTNEAERTIASGFRIGWQHPKTVPPPKNWKHYGA